MCKWTEIHSFDGGWVWVREQLMFEICGHWMHFASKQWKVNSGQRILLPIEEIYFMIFSHISWANLHRRLKRPAVDIVNVTAVFDKPAVLYLLFFCKEKSGNITNPILIHSGEVWTKIHQMSKLSHYIQR